MATLTVEVPDYNAARRLCRKVNKHGRGVVATIMRRTKVGHYPVFCAIDEERVAKPHLVAASIAFMAENING